MRELETGNEFRIDYTLAEIFRLCEADRDAAVHPEFYLALSAEVHPTAELLFEFVQKQGFLLHRTPETLFTMYMAGYVLFLIWREVCVFPLLSKRDSRDARYALDGIREAMLIIIERLRPVVLESTADPFKDLFLGIAASVDDPYDDRYWRNVPDA